MMNQLKLLSSVLLFIFISTSQVTGDRGSIDQKDTPDLQKILEGCSAYCDRLESISLHYICVEEIKETIYHPYRIMEDARRTLQARNYEMERMDRNEYVYDNVDYDDLKRDTETNKYIYDYQLIRKDRIEETRTLIKENGKKKKEEGVELKTKRFRFSNITMSPIAILGGDSQRYFDFELIKEAKLWGKRVYILEASPKPNQDERQLWGKLWVDKENFAVLKIEWDERTMKNYAYIQKQADAYQARPVLKFGTEHRFEKNGIRFPSRHFIKEQYIRQTDASMGQEKLEKSELEVKFKKYKFFIVETEVKY